MRNRSDDATDPEAEHEKPEGVPVDPGNEDKKGQQHQSEQAQKRVNRKRSQTLAGSTRE